jgi:hypothetical protein
LAFTCSNRWAHLAERVFNAVVELLIRSGLSVNVAAFEEVGLETQFHRPELSLWRLLRCVRDYEVRRRLPIQSEFSILKTNLMAVPCIVVIFPVSARLQLDDPISSAASIQLGGDEQSI